MTASQHLETLLEDGTTVFTFKTMCATGTQTHNATAMAASSKAARPDFREKYRRITNRENCASPGAKSQSNRNAPRRRDNPAERERQERSTAMTNRCIQGPHVCRERQRTRASSKRLKKSERPK